MKGLGRGWEHVFHDRVQLIVASGLGVLVHSRPAVAVHASPFSLSSVIAAPPRESGKLGSCRASEQGRARRRSPLHVYGSSPLALIRLSCRTHKSVIILCLRGRSGSAAARGAAVRKSRASCTRRERWPQAVTARWLQKHSKSKEKKHKKKKKKKTKKEPRTEVPSRCVAQAEQPSQAPTESAAVSLAKPTSAPVVVPASAPVAEPRRVIGMMTPAEYQAQRSQVREEWDPDTGRWRSVRGDGEIIERIVSKAEQQRRQQASTHWTGSGLDPANWTGKQKFPSQNPIFGYGPSS